MKKDWSKLDHYIGMPWDKVKKKMRTCGHMLAFGGDPWAIDVAKTFNDHGEEAGIAAIVAASFINKHGPGRTARTAAKIYEQIARQLNDRELICRVDNMSYLVFFMSPRSPDHEWPIPMPEWDVPKQAGLANMMLFMAMTQFKDEESTCGQLAAMGIHDFFTSSKKLGGGK